MWQSLPGGPGRNEEAEIALCLCLVTCAFVLECQLYEQRKPVYLTTMSPLTLRGAL